VRLKDVSAIACITGPGSFTGLRIGLAAVKGLCETHPVPVVPITMLELLAASVDADMVTTVLDAGRREIYVGEYRLREGLPIFVSESLQPLERTDFKGLVITPDAAVARVLKAVEVPRPRPTDLANYAVKKLARSAIITADALDAHYIRRSDAEIFSKPLFHTADRQET
jgi:tRNA threonylcarbamoyladenosine biosynthesis protein TsaB